MDDALHLQRIDPDCNMRRFYSAEVQPNLFGEATLLRRWGRIGGPGRLMLETFADAGAARAALKKLAAAKLRRGYRPQPGAQG